MLQRLSPLQIIITFNDSTLCRMLPAHSPSYVEFRCRASVKPWLLPTLALGASAGMNGARVYFFSAAIARVAASITSLGARAMPSL